MIAPVFTYRWQAIIFFPILAFFLALPFVDKPVWMERAILYRSIEMASNHRNNIFYDILTGESDIDILFLGSSTLSAAINPLIVRAALRSLTGKENTVYTVYHPKAGFDFDYIILKDILQNRRVKLLVWDGVRTPKTDNALYHHATPYVWDYNMHKDLARLLDSDPIDVYLYSVMTGPKLLFSPLLYLGKAIPEEGEDFLCDKTYYLGACLRSSASQASIHYPAPPHLDMKRLLHFRGNDLEDLRDTKSYRSMDYELMKKILELAKEHNTAVALMVAPINNESDHAISVQSIDQNAPGWDLPIIGATLFNVLNTTDIKVEDFFQEDKIHMMFNATNYYTEMLLPAIVKLYNEAITTGIQVPPTIPEALITLHQEAPNETPPHDTPDSAREEDLRYWLQNGEQAVENGVKLKLQEQLGIPAHQD